MIFVLFHFRPILGSVWGPLVGGTLPGPKKINFCSKLCVWTQEVFSPEIFQKMEGLEEYIFLGPM